MHIARVETVRCEGGEQPIWDVAEQALYFIDNGRQKVHRHDRVSGTTRSWDMPAVITSMALRESGGAVVTLRTGIHFLDFKTGALQVVSPLMSPPPYVFNDGKVDRRGRFVIGACTPNFKNPVPDGGLFVLEPDQRVRRLDTGIHFSNGPCWSPDSKTFYFSDSWLHECYAYDYDIESGQVANKRVFANTRDLGGLPDGATVDRDGLVWIAIYRAGKIAAFRPDGGLERIVETPVRMTSSVTFGGPGLDELYLTTIEKGHFGEPTDEGGGYVYVIDGLGICGLPEPRYAG
jgi:L-arabinonolactonase